MCKVAIVRHEYHDYFSWRKTIEDINEYIPKIRDSEKLSVEEKNEAYGALVLYKQKHPIVFEDLKVD